MPKEFDCKREALINKVTLVPLFSYRVYTKGRWNWVSKDGVFLTFPTAEERDADMKAMRKRLKAGAAQ